MAYRKVYFRIRTDCYNSGWSSDAGRAAFKEESRRLFQVLKNRTIFFLNFRISAFLAVLRDFILLFLDCAVKDRQDLYLHPSSFSGVIDEASIQPLQEQLSKAFLGALFSWSSMVICPSTCAAG